MFLSDGQVIQSANVDTLADQTPIFADANYYAAAGVGLLNTFAAYGAIYKTQLWVQTVVKKLAGGTARMPFEVRVRTGESDSVLEAGPMADLLARPNVHMSGLRLWEWTSSTRDVYGEAFWLKLRDRSGRVRELHPMHPTNVIVRRLEDGSIGYVYSNGSVNTSELPTIPQADVVAFTTYNPDNIMRGLSTLEALRMTLLNEDAARRATASMWQKGARPAYILTTDRSLTPGATARLKAQFDTNHAGADNAGSTVVFEEGLKAQAVQLSAEEMQYIASRQLNREEICAAYDVPPPVVHILDHATFSNITEQLRSQYRDTMAPRFVNFESVIDHQLVPDFYNVGDVFTRFNMEDVLRGDFEAKATATSFLRNNGIATGNEVRGMFGLSKSKDPQMDRLFANAALVPLGTPAERITITEATTTDPAQGAEAQNVVDAGQQAAADQAAQAAQLPAAKPPLQLTATPTRTRNVRDMMGHMGIAKQQGATLKVWAAAPGCVAHKSMDGETVTIDSRFSDHSRVPGDQSNGGPDCACTVHFGQE